MKKFVFVLGIMLGGINPVMALEPYLEEVKALGIVSGQGLACGAQKFDTFEMLARAILVTKAPSDRKQAEAMAVYNEAKADAYISKRMDGFYECEQINRQFDNQLIFKATLYADGTLKMPNGEVFTPRQPYDATLVYQKGDDGRAEAEKIYHKKAAKRVPREALQFKTDGAPVVNPHYVSGQSAPVILEPVGYSGAVLESVRMSEPEDRQETSAPLAHENSIGHIRRTY